MLLERENFFLFSDILLFCRKRKKKVFELRGCISLNRSFVKSLEDTESVKNAFELTRLDTKVKFIIQAKSSTLKMLWLKDIMANILQLLNHPRDDEEVLRQFQLLELRRNILGLESIPILGNTKITLKSDAIISFIVQDKEYTEAQRHFILLSEFIIIASLHQQKRNRTIYKLINYFSISQFIVSEFNDKIEGPTLELTKSDNSVRIIIKIPSQELRKPWFNVFYTNINIAALKEKKKKEEQDTNYTKVDHEKIKLEEKKDYNKKKIDLN